MSETDQILSSISEVQLHELALHLGLTRPGGKGNYIAPGDGDAPSLSIYYSKKSGRAMFSDHSANVHGNAAQLIMHIRGCDFHEAMMDLKKFLGIQNAPAPAARKRTMLEKIAHVCVDKARKSPDQVIEYLTGRGIAEETVKRAIAAGVLGFDDWTNPGAPAGMPGHGGAALHFVVKSINPGHVVGVDKRFINPELNGGDKQGAVKDTRKRGAVWLIDLQSVRDAKTVVIVESPINALSVESLKIPRWAAIATRGKNNIDFPWERILSGKRVLVGMDWDRPKEHNSRCSWPGQAASWALYERLIQHDIRAEILDWSGCPLGTDINDVLKDSGTDKLQALLKSAEPWLIPGKPYFNDVLISSEPELRSYAGRCYIPEHDYRVYWKFRTAGNHTQLIEIKKDPDGESETGCRDVAGFRIAALSKIKIIGMDSFMTGDPDKNGRELFLAQCETRRSNELERRVFHKSDLHNTEKWSFFGAVYSKAAFSRALSIWENVIHLGERHAANFVGLHWLNGKLTVSEGKDTFFPGDQPEQLCPYHSLTIPNGKPADAYTLMGAVAETMKQLAGLKLMTWSVGTHLKLFLGFWPHADIAGGLKGSGKTSLIKSFSRLFVQREFGAGQGDTPHKIKITMVNTSFPVTFDEISKVKAKLIPVLVGALQDSYMYAPVEGGQKHTVSVFSAPVLMSGESSIARDIESKTVRMSLYRDGMGPELDPDELPRFPMRQWLEFLSGKDKRAIRQAHKAGMDMLKRACTADHADSTAKRMITNYAALLVAFYLLCEFCKTEPAAFPFEVELIREMNGHIANTSITREPWTLIVETIFTEIDSGRYRLPWAIKKYQTDSGEVDALYIRISHMLQHIQTTPALQTLWDSISIKNQKDLKAQMRDAGVIYADGKDARFNNSRHTSLAVLNLAALSNFRLSLSHPEPIKYNGTDF
ncbi:MAG: hypothetical protein GY862_12955 [Gammaproteobacteria bacterium]|nr:hypothetical protein [Gammaproteobacteria bacterium]